MHVADAQRYDTMIYRQTGRSGLRLPVFSLGLWHNFGENCSYDRQREILLQAFDLGITHFDLANNYGPPPGAAESAFGHALRTDFAPYRDELIISTKAGNEMWPGPYGNGGSRKSMLSSLDQSLKRLGIDYVDIFYSHRPDPNTPMEETMGALHTAVQQGKALYVGISNYSVEQTRDAVRILNELGTPLLLHQPRYSMLHRIPEDGLLATLRSAGAGAIAYSPLEQGLLSNRYLNGIPQGSRAAGASRFLTPERITPALVGVLQQLEAIAEQRGQSLVQMALAWVVREPAVTSAVIGASSMQQLKESVAAAANLVFDETELNRINDLVGTIV